ncbi:MAG TPA: heavy metal translocating P-type ATPase [Vicinamibacterales bacterium]|nr:heavy metal translocating P-type ATPase [Vicinamibacterales bacterium]
MTVTRDAAVCTVCEIHAESVFRVDGMDCHEEVAILERRLKALDGLEDVSADLIGQRLIVRHDAARLSAETIADAVAATGMRAWLERDAPRFAGASRSRLALLMASGAALALGWTASAVGAPAALAMTSYAASVASGGVHLVRRAAGAVRSRAIDINILMTIAVAGALAIGDWAEAATVVFLFALAQFLESRSLDRARHAIRALMDLTPPEAIVVRNGAEQRVPVEHIVPGERVRIRPGDRIPLDGEVISGVSDVNQAPITGESMPVTKRPGDELFAGAINGHGALEMRVTRLRRDTMLARIIHLVEAAQAQRAPAQAFVDRFARYYTPAVIALAAGIAFLPPLVVGAPFSAWLYRALVLLVIACPCALVISTPVAIVSALAAAARQGVLVKGGVHLERAGAVRCIAFDKTGTLTAGRPVVESVEAFDGLDAARLLSIAASLEARSEHAIARSIVEHATADEVPLTDVEAFRALPGLGAEGIVEGRAALTGNARLFTERGLLDERARELSERVASAGRTAVFVAVDGRVAGVIVVADRARPSARDVVQRLRSQGLDHIVMLTGDNAGAARSIGSAVGIDEVRAGLLPEEKVAAVAELRRKYGTVAMVGDGVNDAPALAASDVGIAMGAAGTAAALETADVALMSDDLSKIPYAIRLSRSTLRTIKANITVSLAVKAVFLALAIAGQATLWMAILADTGASLLVIANGLRLLRTA